MARNRRTESQPLELEQPAAAVRVTDARIEKMSTDELAAYVRAMFGVVFDKRQPKSHLIDEALRLNAGDE